MTVTPGGGGPANLVVVAVVTGTKCLSYVSIRGGSNVGGISFSLHVGLFRPGISMVTV